MKQPFKGATRQQILDAFQNRVFYHLNMHGNNIKITPCILDRSGSWHPDTPFITCFSKDWKLDSFSLAVSWSQLFDSWEEADFQNKHINKLYNKGFWRKPYVSISTLEKYKGEMIRIEKLINKELVDYPNFLGIEFCDVHINGIQIRGHHKEINNYSFGLQPTIKYDFTNKNEVITEFVEMWKQHDTPENVEKYKKLIISGENHGWD